MDQIKTIGRKWFSFLKGSLFNLARGQIVHLCESKSEGTMIWILVLVVLSIESDRCPNLRCLSLELSLVETTLQKLGILQDICEVTWCLMVFSLRMYSYDLRSPLPIILDCLVSWMEKWSSSKINFMCLRASNLATEVRLTWKVGTNKTSWRIMLSMIINLPMDLTGIWTPLGRVTNFASKGLYDSKRDMFQQIWDVV